MKFRTDFVTNSSSSSFSVSIELTTDVGEFSELLDVDENGEGDADLNCTPKDILNAGSLAELMELLRNAACDRVGWEDDEDWDEDEDEDEDWDEDEDEDEDWDDDDDKDEDWDDDDDKDEEERWREDCYKSQLAAFAKTVEKKVTSLEQIRHIRLTRNFIAWGEFSTGLLYQEKELKKLAAAVCKSEGEAHEEAVKAMQNYLEQKEIMEDPWPSGFMGGKFVGRYAWKGSVEDLAKQIYDKKLSTEDDAIEVVDIDMVNKTVEFSAKYRLE